ncbi:MAG TPA: dTDP-4-dehydrorhamnose reductase [Acidimicrobiales bacterium]|nr:dTDP-4-dehydrorhamnose reductase [Acidimicrobiales bacterium]
MVPEQAVTVSRRVLLSGAHGQLGRDLQAVLAGRTPDGGDAGSEVALAASRAVGLPPEVDVLATDIDTVDLTDQHAVDGAFDDFHPDVVIHAGAYTAVDASEADPDTAFAVNTIGTRHMAEASARSGAHLLYVSTDYVFDGDADRPYREGDRTNPRSVYGRSKLGGEIEVARSCPSATVVRTAWVSGAHGSNMTKTVLSLGAGPPDRPLRFVADQHGSPTFTADLAPAIVRLALEGRSGTFHVTNQGETTWFGFARAVLVAAGLDPERVEPIATSELDPPRPAPRPANSRLDNSALRLAGLPLLPVWNDALGRLVSVLSDGTTQRAKGAS